MLDNEAAFRNVPLPLVKTLVEGPTKNVSLIVAVTRANDGPAAPGLYVMVDEPLDRMLLNPGPLALVEKLVEPFTTRPGIGIVPLGRTMLPMLRSVSQAVLSTHVTVTVLAPPPGMLLALYEMIRTPCALGAARPHSAAAAAYIGTTKE
jgi:hypothetical protein